MIKKASLLLLLGVGIFNTSSAHAQMQKGYADAKPDITVDRSVLQDLKGYQPPPMFGGDLMPPTSNRLSPPKEVEAPPAVQVVPPAQPTYQPALSPPSRSAAPQPNMTAPNAEALLSHPTQNFHVLTERNTSMTAPTVEEPLDGPLLPLPSDDNDPAVAHARAIKAKEKADKKAEVKKAPVKDEKKKPEKKEDKKSDKKIVKKDDKKENPVKEAPVKPVAKVETKQKDTDESPKAGLIKPNPNGYRPKGPASMPTSVPIQVEKNILPPLSSSSPLPQLPPTTATTEEITKPSVGVRMMDAALERQMETDDSKIKEQLAETKIKVMTKEAPDPVIMPETKETPKKETSTKDAGKKDAINKQSANSKTSQKTLVFQQQDIVLTDKMKTQIKVQILPDIRKAESARVQILSFASAPDGDDGTARRISLSRALAVRDYLKGAEIDAARMDVRALPSDENSVPLDKIDIVLLK